jgi:twitching motility protein PilU
MNIDRYLRLMAERNVSDLFFTTGAPISMKVEGTIRPVGSKPLPPGTTEQIANELMDEKQRAEFQEIKEMNLGRSLEGAGRFRINIFRQRGEVGIVVRFIRSEIPSIDRLMLPNVLKDLVMEQMGLVLVVGATGSGKSTSLASMLDYRNQRHTSHILTIEDPIEFVFQHKKSIVDQREVGMDTLSYGNALKEAMREAPDVIMIGEIRDRANMEHAMAYADTGHLCLSTLHANNAHQALERVLNFFPTDIIRQRRMELSLTLKAIISQRLVLTPKGRRIPAVEIMVNSPFIAELIHKGEVSGIKEVIAKSASLGMQTFDQSLYRLYQDNEIDRETALNHADSRADLEWQMNFGGDVQQSANATPDTIDFQSPFQE